MPVYPSARPGTFYSLKGTPQLFRFSVSTSLIRYASLQAAGVPKAGINWIRVVGSPGDTPLSALDSLPPREHPETGPGIEATLEIKALYPVVLVHGWNARANWFDGFSPETTPAKRFRASLDEGFVSELKAKRVPFNMTMNLGKQVLILDGAQNLERMILDTVLKPFGVSHVHFVAHSKGGLFVRALLEAAARRELVSAGGQPYWLGAYSLTTLDTPHHGNRTADAALPTIVLGEIPGAGGLQDLGIASLAVFNGIYGSPPASYSVHLGEAPTFSLGEDRNSALYFSTRAHADLDNSGLLNPVAQPPPPGVGQTAFDELEGYNSPGIRRFQWIMFQLTGRRLVTLPLQIVGGFLRWQLPRGTWAFTKNDAVVSVDSARFRGFQDLVSPTVLFGDPTIFGSNHSSMGKTSIASVVLNQAIRVAQPMP